MEDFNLDNLQEDDDSPHPAAAVTRVHKGEEIDENSRAFYQQDTDKLLIPKECQRDQTESLGGIDSDLDALSLWNVDPSVGTPVQTPQKPLSSNDHDKEMPGITGGMFIGDFDGTHMYQDEEEGGGGGAKVRHFV